jgi:hypothetical protein
MQSSVERKYIILFAILIAITGFTFESQTGSVASTQAPAQNTQTTTTSHP